MAGSYPDAPGMRLAYDEDGTVVWHAVAHTSWEDIQPGTLSYFDLAQRTKANEEDENSGYTQGIAQLQVRGFCWVFPEPRNVYGWNAWAVSDVQGVIYYVQTSSDTRNGIDGTWTDHTISWTVPNLLYAWDTWYRLGIFSITTSAVRGFRFRVWDGPLVGGGGQFWRCHLYGSISDGYTPNRLLFIDQDTGLEFAAPLDFGDVPRGVTLDHDIKVKNNSGTLTANTNQITFQDISQTSDTWYTIKETGGAFASSLSITSIAAGVTYPTGGNVITIRLAVADDETFGPQATRAKLTTGSWT